MHGRKSSAVTVSIIREKKEQNLTLSLPERNQSEILDESFDLPEVDDAETVIDLSDAQSEIARVRPELERTVREIRRIRPSLEEAAQELRDHQKELQQEMRELEEELRDILRARVRIRSTDRECGRASGGARPDA